MQAVNQTREPLVRTDYTRHICVLLIKEKSTCKRDSNCYQELERNVHGTKNTKQ